MSEEKKLRKHVKRAKPYVIAGSLGILILLWLVCSWLRGSVTVNIQESSDKGVVFKTQRFEGWKRFVPDYEAMGTFRTTDLIVDNTTTIGGSLFRTYAGNPNGVITASRGSLIMDSSTPAVWQNYTGSTVWTNISGGVTGSGTASTLAMFTGTSSVGNSPVLYDGVSLVYIPSSGFTVGTAGGSPTLEPLIVNGTITANSGLTNDFQVDPNGMSFFDSVVGVACGHGSGTDETLAIGFVPNCSVGIPASLSVDTNGNTITGKDSGAGSFRDSDTINTGSSPFVTYAIDVANSSGRGTGTGALTTYGIRCDNPGNGQVNECIHVTRGGIGVAAGGIAVTSGGLTVSAGTTAVQALTATTINGVGTLSVTGGATISGNITSTAGSVSAAAIVNFGNMQLFGGGTENDFYFPSASNQRVNINSSGNSSVNINSNNDGITNSGTGGFNVFAGNNSTTKILGISAVGNLNVAGTGTPTPSHGTAGGGSTNSVGNITGIGSNTSLTLTFSTAYPSRSWCFAEANSTAVTLQSIVVTNSASAPTFSCFTVTTGVAANCDDFSYWCVGQ